MARKAWEAEHLQEGQGVEWGRREQKTLHLMVWLLVLHSRWGCDLGWGWKEIYMRPRREAPRWLNGECQTSTPVMICGL